MKSGKRDKTSQVFVIGLDGGTYTVLRPLIDEGKLPTFAGMMEKGSWGELSSTIPPHTAPAWASFITGKNPGKHGVFQFGLIDRSLYEGRRTRIVNSRTLSDQVLWDIIGREGKRVGVINVPLTYPPYPVNGFMVTGMLTPRGSNNFTYPPYLASSLEGYKIDVSVGEGEYSVLDDLNTEDPEILEGFIQELNALVDMRTKVALRLIGRYTPDFFMVLFTETDRLQHIFWPYLHTDYSQGNDLTGRKLRGALENFYRRLDRNLARLIEAVGENATVILMSDHGFGPSTKKNVNMNSWLQNRGFLKLQKNPSSMLNPRCLLKRIGVHRESFYALANSLFPGHMVRKLERTWGKVAKTPIEWAGTRAVFIPIFEFVGGIQIMGQDDAHELGGNHLGDYENFREYLIQQLLELRDPQTNRPIVLEAYRREELYKGVYTHDAPDIIFVMDTDYRGDKGLLSKSLVSEKLKDISLWTGTHRREGIVVLSGPSITPGKISNTPQILDLTPTILYLLGLAIPEDMDGKVIEEAIESVYLAQNKIEFTKPMSSSKENSEAETAGFSDDEMEKVRKQLEGLGYLS